MNGREKDPPLRVGGDFIADTVPQEDGLLPSAERSFSDEERLEPLVAEACPTKAAKEQLEVSTPVEKDGSGAVVVLRQNWRVQTVNNGTALQYDWTNSMPLKLRPVPNIPGAEMV